jgi:hypothetical protein
MNKVRILLCVFAMVSGAATVKADLTYQPFDADLADLPHDYLYVWKVTPSLGAGQTVTGATLQFDNLNDWTNEADDRLYLRLLSNQNINQAVANHTVSAWLPDLYRGWDHEGGGDSLAGYGISLTTYTDTSPAPEDYTYTFTSAQVSRLNSLIASNGSFGIGLDPDCHYGNDGVTLTLHTATVPTTPVPVPGALLLAGIGAAWVGWTRQAGRRSSM